MVPSWTKHVQILLQSLAQTWKGLNCVFQTPWRSPHCNASCGLGTIPGEKLNFWSSTLWRRRCLGLHVVRHVISGLFNFESITMQVDFWCNARWSGLHGRYEWQKACYMLDACVDRFTLFFPLFVFCFQMLQEELNIIFHHMGEISMWYHNLSFKRQGGACSVSCIYTSYHVFSCFLINCAGQRVLRSLTGPQEMTFLCFQPREASACFICFSLTSFYPTTCLSLSTCLNIAEAPTHHPRAPAAREGFS